MLKDREVSNEGRIERQDCRLFLYVNISEGRINNYDVSSRYI